MKTGIWVIGIMIVLGLGFKFFQDNTVRVQKPPQNQATTTGTYTVYEDKEMGISLVIPEKYKTNIIVKQPLIIPVGSDPESVLIENVILDPSGLNPKITDFKKENIGGKQIYSILISRFEGIISYKFFIKKSNFFVPIDIKWNSSNWMDKDYDLEQDPVFSEGKNAIFNMKFIDMDLGVYEGVINNN